MNIYCDSSTKEACFVIADGMGHPIIVPYSEPVTNNVGEYLAVLYALRNAKERGDKGVEILTDSRLVVNQVRLKEDGGWQCRSPHLLPYIEEIRKLMLETKARLYWVPREENLAGKVLEKRN